MVELSFQQVRVQLGTETPAPRFGHTLTLVSKSKAVLFGGAIGDSGKFIITNESYLFDYELRRWRKLECTGDIPSQRAAHASCQIDHMTMLIYGGAASGGGGLSNDELYLLDLKSLESNTVSKSAHYTKLPTTGPTPGKRYGHTMIYQKPYLIVFGGNTGTVPVNDVWVLNLEKSPFQWSKQCANSQDSPAVRVYHSAAQCTTGSANGMMVIFGGRTQDQSALNDTWGLRRHRNGLWDWVLAPYKQNSAILPVQRYQHRTEFMGSLMLVIGGRTSGGEDQGRCMDVYDTESSDWYRLQSFNRYRHSTVIINSTMYVHGGFEPEFPNKPLDSMLEVELSQIGSSFPKLSKYFATSLNANPTNVLVDRNQNSSLNPSNPSSTLTNQKKLPSAAGVPVTGGLVQTVGQQTLNPNQNMNNMSLIQNPKSQSQQLNSSSFVQSNPNLDISMSGITMNPAARTTIMSQQAKLNPQQRSYTPIKTHKNNKEIKISNQVIVATTQDAENIAQQGMYNQSYSNFQQQQQQQQQQYFGVFKRVNILDLQEESKKLVQGSINDQSMMMMQPADQNTISLADMFVNALMKKPEEWKYTDLRLPFKKEFIIRLCDEVTSIVLGQPSLLRLRVPLKIFGNIHGRFADLLRFFSNFGYPVDEEGGDIEKFDYLFLGNYVDKGFNSLETVILLFALKLKFPDQFHLIRGAHEDRKMNKLFGFAEECAIRLNEDINDPNSVFQRVNRVFDALPLAALIEEKIFAVHGGIGPNVLHVNDIVDIKRPVSPYQNQLVFDLLYSDFAEHESSMLAENKTKDYFSTGNVYKFSEARVESFLEETGLNMIIRSKECVAEGFQRSRSGLVTTITSCTDYMGKYANQAAIIKIKKNFQVEPNLIQKSTNRNGNWVSSDSTFKSNIYFTDEEQKIRRRQVSPLQKLY